MLFKQAACYLVRSLGSHEPIMFICLYRADHLFHITINLADTHPPALAETQLSRSNHVQKKKKDVSD